MKFLFTNNWFFLLAITLFTLPTYAQNKVIPSRFTSQARIDSLLKILPTAKEDTNKAKILYHISLGYRNIHPDESIKYGVQFLALAEKFQWKEKIALANNNLGADYYIKGDYSKSLGLLLKSLKIANDLGNKVIMADVYINIGINYSDQGDYINALNYFLKALKLEEETKNKQGISAVSNDIGSIYYYQNNYAKALEYYYQSLKMDEEAENKNQQSLDMLNIANVYDDMDNYQKALEYYYKSLKIDEETGNENDMANVIGNIGDLFIHQQNYPMAITYEIKALKMDEATGNKRQEDYVLMGLGNAYLELAIDTATASHKIVNTNEITKTGQQFSEGLTPLAGSIPSDKTARLHMAIKYLKQGLDLAKEIHILNVMKTCYHSLSRAYQHTGDYKRAMDCYQNYVEIKDSVFSKEYETKIATISSKYELDKKQSRIDLLEKDNQLSNAKIKHETFQRNTIILCSILILGFIIIAFFAYLQRNTKNMQIAFSRSLMKTQEDEKQRISRDLHDSVGQNILFVKNQLSLLQNDSSLIPVMKAIDNTIDEVRNLSKELYPNQLEKYGLTAAIEAVSEKVTTATGIFVSADLQEIEPLLSKNAKINIFRVIQESLNNIIKHAEATAVRITGSAIKNKIVLMVIDNGKGFDTNILEYKSQTSYGLLNMEERVKMLDGKMELESTPTGTKVTIIIPI